MNIASRLLFAGIAMSASHFSRAELYMDNQTEHAIEGFYVPDEGSGFAGYRFLIDNKPVVNAEFTPNIGALFTPAASKEDIKKAETLLTKLPLFPEVGDQTVIFFYSKDHCPEGALAAQVPLGEEVLTFCMATDKTIADGNLWIAVVLAQPNG